MPYKDPEKKKAHAKEYRSRPSTKERNRKYQFNWWLKNKEKILARQKNFRPRQREYLRRYRATHPEYVAKQRETHMKYYIKNGTSQSRLRARMLEMYGHACECCGESRKEFLALDHRNNDGAAHRKEIRSRTSDSPTSHVYRQAVMLGFPNNKFRLLCHNCNMARGFYGFCPHEKEQFDAIGMAC